MNNKVIKRGDIFFAELTGHESVMKGSRPVVVVSNNANNLYSTTVTVVPCTTKLKELPVHYSFSYTTCFTRESQALCEQIITIPKSALLDKIGHLDERDWTGITNAIQIQLGLGGSICFPRSVETLQIQTTQKETRALYSSFLFIALSHCFNSITSPIRNALMLLGLPALFPQDILAALNLPILAS